MIEYPDIYVLIFGFSLKEHWGEKRGLSERLNRHLTSENSQSPRSGSSKIQSRADRGHALSCTTVWGCRYRDLRWRCRCCSLQTSDNFIRFDCDLTFDEPSETWTLHSVALLHPTPIREVMGQKVQFSYPGPGLNKWQALLLQLWFVLC
ncbi:hypothetical protein SLEP1_g11647 [Rubroshorea leprosula]|nr:hypothetical protein SLEP1_g11647 [Rubroshorea leprosula]